jgi:hypothetical protein
MKTTDILNSGYIKPETYNERPDHEVQMARSELYRAGKCAMELHNMLKRVGESQGLEGWVQAKITKAADYLESVYHYLDYEMRNPSDEMDEASPVAPGSIPAGGVSTPGDAQTAAPNPANAALEKQKAAAAIALQKKQIQDQIKATQKQLQDLQKQMQTIGSVAQAQPMAEMGSAGASVSGGMASAPGAVKDKKKVGSLFGGAYKQNEDANLARQAAIAIAKKKKKGMKEANYQGWVSNPQARMASKFAHDPDRAAVNYKANKYDPKTGLGGYVANRASSRDDTNILIQLKANLDSAYSKPIRFDDGSSLKIGPGTARKALNRLDAMRPAERHDTVNSIVASKDAFVSFVKASSESVKEGGETGPKFTGYYKGTDKGKPGKKMVGDA